ncbi:MAG TPA: hypothetical protein VKB12_15585 [Pyrinomonadaceae bacterium]|nr:hypothetical protein [Pyrinomonadaceae bacterium]
MRIKRVTLWGGMLSSVVLCLAASAGGALAVFQSVVVGSPGLGTVYFWWAVSFAGTFTASVIFFILMLREGELGR